MTRARGDELLLGEWACLGILYPAPAHGFAVAGRLQPTGDVGRVWSLSRPLTYRSLDQLTARGYIHAVATEPGRAGGNRTILAATRSGRGRLRTWLRTPVQHLRDLRSELLLKLILAEQCGIDPTTMLAEQRIVIATLSDTLPATLSDTLSDTLPDTLDPRAHDVVTLWRWELSRAALRFLDRLPPQP